MIVYDVLAEQHRQTIADLHRRLLNPEYQDKVEYIKGQIKREEEFLNSILDLQKDIEITDEHLNLVRGMINVASSDITNAERFMSIDKNSPAPYSRHLQKKKDAEKELKLFREILVVLAQSKK